MGRHKKAVERPIVPDERYNSTVVSKFVTRMMLDGKKQTCFKIIYKALDNLKAKTDKDPLEVFLKALDNVSRQRKKCLRESHDGANRRDTLRSHSLQDEWDPKKL